MYDDLVKQRLSKLRGEFGNIGTSQQDLDSHRRALDHERRKTDSKKTKKLSQDQRALVSSLAPPVPHTPPRVAGRSLT